MFFFTAFIIPPFVEENQSVDKIHKIISFLYNDTISSKRNKMNEIVVGGTGYLPKLHTNMQDWKKVLWYNENVTKQFPGLNGSFPDMTTLEYKEKAIQHVNCILLQQRIAYESRVKQREKKARRLEQEEKMKEDAHVAEMKKKYGHGWEKDVEGKDEDCETASKLREENERQDLLDYYRREDEELLWDRDIDEEMNKKDHEDALFDVRMEFETRAMLPAVKMAYIQEKQRSWQQKRTEEEESLNIEVEAEGEAWTRAIESGKMAREAKKLHIAKYEEEKKNEVLGDSL